MKKVYINPQIDVIQLKANQTLLAGSVRSDGQGGYDADIFSTDYDSSTDEKI